MLLLVRDCKLGHALNPFNASNNVEATLSNATKSNVACFDSVERCFDIVAGVDRALVSYRM